MNKCGFDGLTRSKHVFPEDLKVSEKKILDPQDKFLLQWNQLFVVSCILAVSIDTLLFYLPVFDQTNTCLGIDRKLAIVATTLRTVVDVFLSFSHGSSISYCFYCSIISSSRVFGRGELVIDPAHIAKRHLKCYFIIDILSILPLTQIVGAFWYLLSVERNDTCWKKACKSHQQNTNFLYCRNEDIPGYNSWSLNSTAVVNERCSPDGDSPPFDFGIFNQALSSGIVFSKKFVQKYCYCLWWGLQNLSTLGQGLKTSTYPGETIFSIALAIS